MKTEKEVIMELREEFFKKFENKYELRQEVPLGEGYYACVFKAYDIDRKIEVAIKIFFDGFAPIGSERGWHITSSFIHNQIAQTSTIESFYSHSLKKDCKVAVQRFIPGKSLKSIINKFGILELEQDENYQYVLNDFGLSYLKSLLSILTFCHKQNFGHGDCHDGNIMIIMEPHNTRHSFRAILIDFDNASIKETLSAKTETEKIESDIGLLKYFFTKTFSDWKYYEPVKLIFYSYDSMIDFQFSYSIVSEYIECCIKGNNSKAFILSTLAKLPHPLMGFQIPPTINCLRKVAELENSINDFEDALNEYRQAISNQDNWKHELTIEVIEGAVTNIYRDIFD